MRRWALVVAVVAGGIMLVLFLLPANVAIQGTYDSSNCSSPLLRVIVRQRSDTAVQARLVQKCESASLVRVGVGLAVGVAGLSGAIVLALLGRPQKPVWDQLNYRWIHPD